LPNLLYDHGVGWVLGRRFLRLAHTGRRSGERYFTVLEVVRFDPGIPEFVVVSGFGPGADWLRNLEAGGPAFVTVGRSTFAARHRRLTVEEAVAVFAADERSHRALGPVLRRVLSRLLGWPYDGSAEARRRMAGQLPLVALHPATGHDPATPWQLAGRWARRPPRSALGSAAHEPWQ
jgi:deazaflavin-dependent oxidoreductase (nitroreductase family)